MEQEGVGNSVSASQADKIVIIGHLLSGYVPRLCDNSHKTLLSVITNWSGISGFGKHHPHLLYSPVIVVAFISCIFPLFQIQYTNIAKDGNGM